MRLLGMLLIVVLSTITQAQPVRSPDFNPLRWREIDDEPWVRTVLQDLKVRGAVECAAEPDAGYWYVIVKRGPKRFTAHRIITTPQGERLRPLGGEDLGKRHETLGQAKYAVNRERYSDFSRRK